MTILKPTTGQLYDRKITLGLKLLRVGKKAHWVREHDAVTKEIRRRVTSSAKRAKVRGVAEKLEETLRSLWDLTETQKELCTDLVKFLDVSNGDAAKRALKGLWYNNNLRHRLVEQIDAITGEFEGSEK